MWIVAARTIYFRVHFIVLNIDPTLCRIQPEEADRRLFTGRKFVVFVSSLRFVFLSLVREHVWNGTVQRHRILNVVFEHVQIEQTVRIGVTTLVEQS